MNHSFERPIDPAHPDKAVGKMATEFGGGSAKKRAGEAGRPQIRLFGHFGAGNLGNESTLIAMLENLRRLIPDADIRCICSMPNIVSAEYGISAISMTGPSVVRKRARKGVTRFFRKIFVGIPAEVRRWQEAHRALRGSDCLIIVGTGLLTNAFSLFGWGPFSTFKWSLLARMRGCQVLFVSVGAGPVNRFSGRLLVKAALSLASFRSYRDQATRRYLESIGFVHPEDPVFPDLAFSLPPVLLSGGHSSSWLRRVVGLGLMTYGGMYGIQPISAANYENYLKTLADFGRWLLNRGYDLRLVIGDQSDIPTLEQFEARVKQGLGPQDCARIAAEPALSTRQLLHQLAETDLVVGTRFHNVLLALFLSKPSIAIAFHHKCSGLMEEMGISEYSQDIHGLTLENLTEKFCAMEDKAGELTTHLADKVLQNRAALDVQYRIICRNLGYSEVSSQPWQSVRTG